MQIATCNPLDKYLYVPLLPEDSNKNYCQIEPQVITMLDIHTNDRFQRQKLDVN